MSQRPSAAELGCPGGPVPLSWGVREAWCVACSHECRRLLSVSKGPAEQFLHGICAPASRQGTQGWRIKVSPAVNSLPNTLEIFREPQQNIQTTKVSAGQSHAYLHTWISLIFTFPCYTKCCYFQGILKSTTYTRSVILNVQLQQLTQI